MTPVVVAVSVVAALGLFALLVYAMRKIDAEYDGIVDVTIPIVSVRAQAIAPDSSISLLRRTGIYAIDPEPGTSIAALAHHAKVARARGVRQIAMPVAVFERMCAIAQRATDDQSKERTP